MILKCNNFKNQGYMPNTIFTEDQKAYLEDKITSLMTQAAKLERDSKKLKEQTNKLLEEVRCLSIQKSQDED